MRRHFRRFLVASVLLCGACAPNSNLPPLPFDEIEAERRLQQIAQLQDYYAQLHRLDSVAFRLRTANRDFCNGWVSAQIGLYALTPQSLPRKYRSFSAEALNLSWVRPTVISVVDGSPAAAAGIAAGDEIIALNGELVPVTSTAGWIGGWLKANGDKPVRVDLRRKGAYHTVTVSPMLACAIPINLQTSETANAETDGTKITVHSAMLDVTRTDAQLAVIVGHELAHANLGHHEKKQINALLGTAGGALVDMGFLLGGIPTDGIFTRQFRLAGANAFSIAFEREADYVGSYYAARAGYALAGVEQVWREFGKLHPESIRFAATHPTTPMRIVQLQKVAAEIADKQRRNLPLVPELKLVNAGADAAMDAGEIVR